MIKAKFLVVFLTLTMVLILSACGTLQITIVTPVNINVPGSDEQASPTNTAEITEALPSPSPTTNPIEEQAPTGGGSSSTNQSLRLQPENPFTINSIHMVGFDNGWAIGRGESTLDRVLYTLDEGQTWRDVTPEPVLTESNPALNDSSAYFLDENNAWISFGSQEAWQQGTPVIVWSTRDAGKTWFASQPLAINDLPFEFIHPTDLGFIDPMHGWIMLHMGAGMNHDYIAIYTTKDSGLNWQRVVDPNLGNVDMSCYKTGLVFTTPERGFLTGNCNGVQAGIYFATTSDGGQTWNYENLPAQANDPTTFISPESACGASMPSFNDPQHGRVLVSCYLNQENITRTWLFITLDGGLSWAPLPSPTAYGTYQFVDAQTGWWLSNADEKQNPENGLYLTPDSGNTWSLVIKPAWSGQLDFLNETTGWVVARANDQVALVYTQTGGKTWREIKPQIVQ